MAEPKITGLMRIVDGNTNLRTLKELNTLLTTINTNLEKLIPVSLYNNGSGTKSVTISNLSNYNYLDIEIRTKYYDMKQIVRYYLDTLPNSDGNAVNYHGNFNMCFLAYDGCIQDLVGHINRDGNTISISQEHYINHIMGSNTINCNSIDRMYITKIFGYKK